MLKKIYSVFILSLFILSVNYSYAIMATIPESKEKLAADFLSYKDIINTQENWEWYKLEQKITRREMAKVTLNLSGVNVINSCSWTFSDLKSWDWGCKYAETWVKNNFFAKNFKFNPDNNISKIEALKMVMKGRKINKEKSDDWREGYVKAAVKAWLLENKFTDYDTLAKRWWIFVMAKRAIEYSWKDPDIKVIEELLNI